MSYNDPSATLNFTGYDPLNLSFSQTEAGVQVAAWAGPSPAGWSKPFSVLEAVTAQSKCFVTGSGLTAPNPNLPQQASGTVSLSSSGGSLQLTGNVCSPSNVSTTAAQAFSWRTNSPTVATVDSKGLVTFLKKGFVTIECRYGRAVSPLLTASVPAPTDAVYATVDLTVLP
jgi:hypothetical protein